MTWADVAPTKPANAANPFDPAYNFDDLDEFVRNAQLRDTEVLITLWGTPKWANGNKGRNYLPTSMTDFQNFAKAVASRYSGRTAGYPFVRFYGIWNESNLGLFLTPQFNSKGQIVSPAAYAKLAAAGYAGIKAGNSEGARRDRRDVVERTGQEEGGRERLRRARARSPSSSRRRTRSSSSTPGRSTRTPCR